MKRRKTNIKCLAVTAALTASLTVCGISTSAAALSVNSVSVTDLSYASDGRVYQTLNTIGSKNLASYQRQTVSVGGVTLSVKGFVANGTAYIPFRAAASAIAGSSYN